MFQQLSFDAPARLPVLATPSNTMASSGPPSVVQITFVDRGVAPAGMPDWVMEPAYVPLRPTPPDTMSAPVAVVEIPTRSPVPASRVPADSTRMRGLSTLLSGSVIGLPVLCSADSTVGTSVPGLMLFMRAQAPATCGAAIDVPLLGPVSSFGTVLSGIDDSICPPGASSSTSDDEFEKLDTTSVFSVEPTVIASEMHDGKLTPVLSDALPDAMTVAMSLARNVVM